MKYLIVFNASILILCILTMLAQLWFSVFELEAFRKVLITEGAILVIALVITFVKKELTDSKRLKNGGNLDL
jgi:hypothetical protein